MEMPRVTSVVEARQEGQVLDGLGRIEVEQMQHRIRVAVPVGVGVGVLVSIIVVTAG